MGAWEATSAADGDRHIQQNTRLARHVHAIGIRGGRSRGRRVGEKC